MKIIDHALICIVGLHGSGKTSVGACLSAANADHQHISVGDIARLGRRGRVPDGVPTRLMSCLARHTPGTVFSFMTATLLRDYLIHLAGKGKIISVDGFPSSPEHLALLPGNTRIWHITSTERTRHSRLEERGMTTARKWVNGGPSQRDAMLMETLERAKSLGFLVEEVENNSDLDELKKACTELINRTSPTP